MSRSRGRRGRGADEILLGFTRALRASGVPVTLDRAQAYPRGGVAGRRRRPARDVLGGPRDAVRRTGRPRPTRPGLRGLLQRARRPAAARARPRSRRSRPPPPSASTRPESGASEPTTPSRRCVRRPAHGGAAAPRRRVDDGGGEAPARGHVRDAHAATPDPAYGPPPAVAPRRPGRLAHDARQPAPHGRARRDGVAAPRRRRPRRVVLLVDVSGSMSAYADALLRLAHRFTVSAGSTGGAGPRRDVHRRHPADPRDPGDAVARPGPGDRRGRRDRP